MPSSIVITRVQCSLRFSSMGVLLCSALQYLRTGCLTGRQPAICKSDELVSEKQKRHLLSVLETRGVLSVRPNAFIKASMQHRELLGRCHARRQHSTKKEREMHQQQAIHVMFHKDTKSGEISWSNSSAPKRPEAVMRQVEDNQGDKWVRPRPSHQDASRRTGELSAQYQETNEVRHKEMRRGDKGARTNDEILNEQLNRDEGRQRHREADTATNIIQYSETSEVRHTETKGDK